MQVLVSFTESFKIWGHLSAILLWIDYLEIWWKVCYFFRNSYYLSFSEKEKKKFNHTQVIHYPKKYFTTKWKFSSTSYFYQQESFISLSDNRKYGLPFLLKATRRPILT